MVEYCVHVHFKCNARSHYLCLLEQHYNSLGASCRLLKRPWHLSTMALCRANLLCHTGTILVINCNHVSGAATPHTRSVSRLRGANMHVLHELSAVMKDRVHAKHATVRCAGRTWHCSDCKEMFCQRRAARLHENFGCSDLRRRARQNVEAVDAGKHFTCYMLVHKCVATLLG